MRVPVPNPACTAHSKSFCPAVVTSPCRGAAIGQRLASLRVCQADFCLLPLQLLALAFVRQGGIGFYYGHHSSVHFGDYYGAAARLRGPALVYLGRLEYVFGVSLGNAANGALAQDDAVVFNQFVHHLGKGQVSSKVGDCALQRARTAPVADFGALCKGANPLGSMTILRFLYADIAKEIGRAHV